MPKSIVVLDNLYRFVLGRPRGRRSSGDTGDQALPSPHPEHGIEGIVHFAASVVVPIDAIRSPLSQITRSMGAVCWRAFIFPDCAVYGSPAEIPVTEDLPTQPAALWMVEADERNHAPR
jgi:UDP-glucose 4-epimerase